MMQDNRGRLHAIATHKVSSAAFYDLGYIYSDDSGDHWSPIREVTNDANERKLSYAHPMINAVELRGRVGFVSNMWTGRQPSPIYYGEIEVAG